MIRYTTDTVYAGLHSQDYKAPQQVTTPQGATFWPRLRKRKTFNWLTQIADIVYFLLRPVCWDRFTCPTHTSAHMPV